MKEAAGELNLTVITVVAIAAVAALLWYNWDRIAEAIENAWDPASGVVDTNTGKKN